VQELGMISLYMHVGMHNIGFISQASILVGHVLLLNKILLWYINSNFTKTTTETCMEIKKKCFGWKKL